MNARILALLCFIPCAAACAGQGATDWKGIDDLPNPGRGWTTFHSYPSDRRNDRYPDSAIAYFRYTWRELEPVDGVIDFGLLDRALERARKEGQRLAFRVMPDNSGGHREALPAWLIASGIGGVRYRESLGARLFMPDFDDPMFIERARRLIQALGERYDGNPALDHVDIGMVGHWGEWHVSQAEKAGASMPTLASARQYVDMHMNAFTRTPLVMLIGGTDEVSAQALSYAVGRGAGWRADCWGDYRRGWNHMESHYPLRLAESAAGEAWKRAPVALETCGVPGSWYLLFPGRIDDILRFAVDNHASILNAKSSGIPAQWVEKFRQFTARIGYRLSFEPPILPGRIPVTGDSSLSARIEIHWRNEGNAPPYLRLVPTLRLQRAGVDARFASTTDPRSWLPGEGYGTTFQVSLPEGSPPGPYDVYIGLVVPESGEPGIRLAQPGDPNPAGLWYPLGRIVADRP